MKHLVLGAPGQLGNALCVQLAGSVVALSRAEADLLQPASLQAVLDRHRPDVVFNCAAYNFVDRAESEPEAAMAVNAWAVRNLARLCDERGTLLVHFSSDYVFGLDQERRTPYQERDLPGPLSVYGVSKLAGEHVVRACCRRHLIVRTCGLYGRIGGGKGKNFVETMLRLGGEGKALRVVADQRCTPSAAKDVAAATLALVRAGAVGLFHVTNSGSCSWHEFAATIFELAGLAPHLTAVTSAEYVVAARRPAWSVLDTGAYQRLGLEPLRPWRDALADYLAARASVAGGSSRSQ